MVLTVLENAYLKKARDCENYTDTHHKLLLALLHEQKYHQKDELLCFANNCESKLEKALKELERAGVIKTEGWLVKITDPLTLHEMIETKKAISIKAKN